MLSSFEPWPAGEWRRALADAVTRVDKLLELVELEAADLAGGPTASAVRRFPLRVPRGFIARMTTGDPSDPLLRQVLPLGVEDDEVAGFTADPVGELGLALDGGVMTKYHGRALIVVTGACAVHCRYCFRRHFPYDEHRAGDPDWSAVVEAIAGDASVDEVILSGGDPLSIPDRRLRPLVDRVVAIDHIRRLRVHTRLPVVLPERVDEDLVAWIAACPRPVVIVIHANHPAEIDSRVERALGALRRAGATLLNQAVLLAGVNDSVPALDGLSRRLADCGVVPYYLHLLDRVAGAAHFEVEEGRALTIMDGLRVRLPGYLVPRLVREIPGAPSKVVVG